MMDIYSYISKLYNYLAHDLIGGPKIFQLNWIINLMKGLTPLYIILLMSIYQNFSLGAYLQFALHGSYGILWFLKDLTFPDKSWQTKQTIFSSMFLMFFLSLYWMIDWLQISGNGINEPSMSRVATSCLSYIFGVSLMLVSDAQKYYTLKLKRGLITEGMFKFTRNPNYLGEIMLYLSFAITTGNLYAYGFLSIVWGLFFYANMLEKDKSFSTKQGWDNYKKSTWILLPKIVPSSNLITASIYGIFGALLYYDYRVGGGISLLQYK